MLRIIVYVVYPRKGNNLRSWTVRSLHYEDRAQRAKFPPAT